MINVCRLISELLQLNCVLIMVLVIGATDFLFNLAIVQQVVRVLNQYCDCSHDLTLLSKSRSMEFLLGVEIDLIEWNGLFLIFL